MSQEELCRELETSAKKLPPIIQGGMGVGISGWRLARAVSRCGQLGVVSGTALDVMLVRVLQDGDREGHMRRALEAFPDAPVAQRIRDRYFIAGGKPPEAAYAVTPMISHRPSRATQELIVVAAFVAIHLAKEGHDGAVGLNLLEKIQTPTLFVLYGAMLAGVDVVLMGAGIPRQIPGVLDALADGRPAEMRLDVTGAREALTMALDPNEFFGSAGVKRPCFLAIVSSPVLAMTLQRKSNGRVDGFVVEGPIAGGHNAPPRGALQLDERGEPIYGERDQIDPAKFAALGLPFWLAGGYGRVGKLREAQAQGAAGIQAGTVFALCDESGFDPALKARILASVRDGSLKVQTNAYASPTGFPFKVAQVAGSVADDDVYQQRGRICDLGVLRECYEREDGTVGFRCPAEPVDAYLAKGGNACDTTGRLCLCNSLFASTGMGQVRDGLAEAPLITIGDDLEAVREQLTGDRESYSAADVIARMLE